MRYLLLLLPVFLVVSCAADKKATTSAATGSTERPTMDQRFRGKTITQDKNGEWPAEVKKEFLPDSNRQTAYFKEKSDLPKAYKTGEYAKTAWWGKKEVARKSYGGKTDGSRFQTPVRDQGKATCPLKCDHPPNGNEFAVGCGMCRAMAGAAF